MLHTLPSSCLVNSGYMSDTHRHYYVDALLHAQTYMELVAYSFFTLTGEFPLHACSVTWNLRTCFASVGRVFLVETVVMQTVLWDIRAWSVHFLVSYMVHSKSSVVGTHPTVHLSIQKGDASQSQRLQGSDCSSHPPRPLSRWPLFVTLRIFPMGDGSK